MVYGPCQCKYKLTVIPDQNDEHPSATDWASLIGSHIFFTIV